MAIKSLLSTDQLIELYRGGKTLEEISPLAGIGTVAIWKRLTQAGVEMRPPAPRGPWAKEKRGEEYLGGDGRFWVRGIKSSKGKNAKRKAVVVMEEFLGESIPKGYVVHHKNGIPTDDRIENLELLPEFEHSRLSRIKWSRQLHYRDFSEAYYTLNRSILTYPHMIDYQENTRGIIENLFITVDSIDCEEIDLAPLGYAKQKWGNLVKTYLDMDQLRNFFHLCTISKGSSIAFDFKRKTSGNGSCMREIILTRCNHKKQWDTAKVIWRATELQKRWAADLILIHHILKNIPNCQLKRVEFYMASAYQSGVYVVPLIGPLFGVDITKLDPGKSKYWKVIQYQNAKRFQPDSPRHKLSPGWRMQDVAKAFRDGKKFEPLTYKDFELEV